MDSTALIVIDAQESFRQRSYWVDSDVSEFVRNTQTLIDQCKKRNVPVVQIFHTEDAGVFALASGFVKTLEPIKIAPDVIFQKRYHSALAGTPLAGWLNERGIRRLIISGIRTEQCCETTTRHASDIGYQVDYVAEATLTFAMTDRHGKHWTPAQIRERTELVLDGRFARIATVEESIGAAARLA